MSNHGSTPDSADPGRRLLLVPHRIGPVVDLDAATRTTVDELDAALDEIFGDLSQERPGAFDGILIVGGLVAAAWGMVDSTAAPVLVGLTSVLLGVALPARSLSDAWRERRRATARGRAMAAGLPLDASDATVERLIDAYAACITAASASGDQVGGKAADAAHQALVEVASLLAGRRPIARAEIDYITSRTRALERTTTELERARRSRITARRDAFARHSAAWRQRAADLVQARRELESGAGTASVDRLVGLRHEIRSEKDR